MTDKNPFFEFLNLTDAQRVAQSDQAQAQVAEEFPELVPILDKGSELLYVLSDAVFNHPKAALLAMQVMEDSFEMFRLAIAEGEAE